MTEATGSIISEEETYPYCVLLQNPMDHESSNGWSHSSDSDWVDVGQTTYNNGMAAISTHAERRSQNRDHNDGWSETESTGASEVPSAYQSHRLQIPGQSTHQQSGTKGPCFKLPFPCVVRIVLCSLPGTYNLKFLNITAV